MSIFSKLLGGNKDTSWDATTTGVSKSIADMDKLSQRPTGLSEGGKYGQMANSIKSQQELGQQRKLGGGQINGQRGVLGNQYRDNSASLDSITNEQARQASAMTNDINNQDEMAYNADARLRPSLNNEKEDSMIKSDLADYQAEAMKPSMWDKLSSIGGAGLQGYMMSQSFKGKPKAPSPGGNTSTGAASKLFGGNP